MIVSPSRLWPLRLGLGLALFALTGCEQRGAPRDAGLSTPAQWAEARARWHIDRDPAAYAEWVAIEPDSQEGREARRLLAEAEPHYRMGIERVRDGDSRARESFERAVRVAPMAPALYLPLARAFRDQGRTQPDNPHLFIRAAEYYRKFLALEPRHAQSDAARAELAEIDPDGSRLFAPPPRQTAAGEPLPAPESTASWPLWVAFLAMLLAIAAVALLVVRSRGPRESLGALAERRPELHPAITYLVSSLRHELLKHRIGAVGDAVDALRDGSATGDQLEFLRGRLYGGEPLVRAWEGHLSAFERALGPELDVRHGDPPFRDAGRAILAITKLEIQVKAGAPRAFKRLAEAHASLRALDLHLSELTTRLVRTSVDGALFREVVEAVRGEYAAGQITLDEVAIRSPDPAPLVEVFRVDLVLILKNVVRNAILAVGAQDSPRRIGLHVRTEVEPTGEETVLIHVSDTCAQGITTEDIYARRMSRGLGLVTAALARYNGAIAVQPTADDFAKSVVVRFFRAYADDR